MLKIKRMGYGFAASITAIVSISCGFLSDSTGVTIPMRDGTELAADLFLSPYATGKMPCILIRTTYNKGADKAGLTMAAAVAKGYNQLGYAVLVQDSRGRFASAGVDSIFFTDGAGHSRDGYDTIEWIVQQEWSDGNVGMWGISALAITTYMAATSGHPALKCAWVSVGASSLYDDVFFPGGVYRKNMADTWVTGQGREEFLPFIYSQSSYNKRWQAIDLRARASEVKTAIYHVGGWYDAMSLGQTRGFSALQERGGDGAKGNQMMVLGPWSHGGNGQKQGALEYPPNNNDVKPWNDVNAWFDHHLKNSVNKIDSLPAVRYYLMGDVDDSLSAGNIWVESESWPPAATNPTQYYLQPDGGLSTSPSRARNSSASYSYDPRDPVVTQGGLNLYPPIGPADMREVEARSDVLTFTTEPLSKPLAIAGSVTVKLWASSSAEDTDFMAMFTDVYPDGRSMLLLDGPIRARHRSSLSDEEFMVPETIYEFEIDLWETANVFNTGHRIRLDITSSNSPRFQVNPNTPTPFHAPADTVVATNTIFHDRKHPASITLPILNLDSVRLLE